MSKSKDKQIAKVDSVWSVKISDKETLLVEKGDKVKSGQPIFKKSKKEYQRINASAMLSCRPKKIAPLILLPEGGKVSRGDCLISMGKLFSRKRLISPVSGTFAGFNQQTGEIRIAVKTGEERIHSPVKGEVIEVSKDRLRIRFKAFRIIGQKAGRGKSWGKLAFLNKSIEEDDQKIIFGEKLTITDIEKLIVLGGRGFLSFDFPAGFEKLSVPGLIIKEEKEVLDILDTLSDSSTLLDSDGGQLLICMD